MHGQAYSVLRGFLNYSKVTKYSKSKLWQMEIHVLPFGCTTYSTSVVAMRFLFDSEFARFWPRALTCLKDIFLKFYKDCLSIGVKSFPSGCSRQNEDICPWIRLRLRLIRLNLPISSLDFFDTIGIGNIFSLNITLQCQHTALDKSLNQFLNVWPEGFVQMFSIIDFTEVLTGNPENSGNFCF